VHVTTDSVWDVRTYNKHASGSSSHIIFLFIPLLPRSRIARMRTILPRSEGGRRTTVDPRKIAESNEAKKSWGQWPMVRVARAPSSRESKRCAKRAYTSSTRHALSQTQEVLGEQSTPHHRCRSSIAPQKRESSEAISEVLPPSYWVTGHPSNTRTTMGGAVRTRGLLFIPVTFEGHHPRARSRWPSAFSILNGPAGDRTAPSSTSSVALRLPARIKKFLCLEARELRRYTDRVPSTQTLLSRAPRRRGERC